MEKNQIINRHLTPSGVALYMRGEGAAVGRSYNTHGDIWDDKKETVQTGLLHLILDELKEFKAQKKCRLQTHRLWLECHRERDFKLMSQSIKHIERVKELLGGQTPGRDFFTLGLEIEDYYRSFCNQNGHYWTRLIPTVRGRLDRMKSVKCMADVILLDGVGQKTMEKMINKKIQESSKEKK